MSALAGTYRDEAVEEIGRLKREGLYRQRLCIDSAQSRQIILQGKKVLNFCSNDYLGLASDPRLVAAFQQAATDYGVGSGASPLVCGRSSAHAELEQELAAFTKRDRAVVFSSGYLANLALVNTLAADRRSHVFQDRLNHASMLDGAVLSRARLHRYPHRDVIAFEKILKKYDDKRKLVFTDSVFSMDGDVAPLQALALLCRKYDACLVVDDAHGFGISGPDGAGTLAALGLEQSSAPLMMATLGKSLGCAGAFVAGTEELIDLLIQKGRSYIYSTALAPALAVAATSSLRLIKKDQWRRQHLEDLIEYFRTSARDLGLPILDSHSPIQPLMLGSAKKAVSISEFLLKSGILVTAIRPPTVPANTARLRITLSAGHSREDVDLLLNTLAAIGPM